MEIVKKNLLSILCGVVALMAIAAIFWPIGKMYDDLHKMLDSSITIGTNLQLLGTKSRSQPLLSPEQDQADPLKVFPMPNVIAAGTAATQEINVQSTAMMAAAVTANRHVPLLATSLPIPTESTKYDFAKTYVEQTTGDARRRTALNAGMRPTDAEVTAGQDKRHAELVSQAVAGDTQSLQQQEDQYNLEKPTIKPQMDLERAREISVYLEPGAFIYDTTIGTGAGHQNPDGGKIWDAQLSLWVLDDITKAITDVNRLYSDPAGPGESDGGVLRSVVKQIEHIDNPVVVSPSATDLTAGADNTAVPKEYTGAVTGHVSNGMYDVLRFNVILEVDAAKVGIVLRQLQVDQFITVLNVQLTNVDAATAVSSEFIYGNKPVVRLEIQCEELLLHDWMNDLVPDSRNFAKGYKAVAGAPGDSSGGYPGMPGGGPPMPGSPGMSPRF